MGKDPAIAFAVGELEKYLKKMDGHIMTAILAAETFQDAADTLRVGLDPAFSGVPGVDDPRFDDAIYVDVKDGCGIITGSNPRSVLIAVYRYLAELGCAFLRPGKDGEVIPKTEPDKTGVHIAEKASYRHRSVCIEGADSFENVRDMIDWLPKVGMNGYFTQFLVPFTFFDRWYRHEDNPTLPPEPVTVEEVAGMRKILAGEIKKRGMSYHAAGHGWTCEPLGIPGLGWDTEGVKVPAGTKKYFALVNGKRELWNGVPLNTNLCYSNPAVRERMTDAIVEYLVQNPEVDYLHFWLADDSNNHCECENCVERPSDYYVMLLNLLDKKLTARGIETKVVFLIYVDLLWEPVKEKLLHPERFVLMFAPITRTYSRSFTDTGADEIPLSPYVKNRLKMPATVGENIARLKRWQSFANCDSFDFDYHFMWDHFLDPGYFRMAQILYKDMKGLCKIGLNGMLSCQCQRVFFPSSLGMAVMAKTLWNRETPFEKIASDYFNAAFGEDGGRVMDYLKTLSDLFDPEYLRAEKPAVNPENAEKYAKMPAVVGKFLPVILENIHKDHPNAVKLSWTYLAYHADYCILLSHCLAFRAQGNEEAAHTAFDELVRFMRGLEPKLQRVFDLFEFIETYRRVLGL